MIVFNYFKLGKFEISVKSHKKRYAQKGVGVLMKKTKLGSAEKKNRYDLTKKLFIPLNDVSL